MNKYLNISEKANIVLHALAFIGAKENKYVSASDIAKELNVSRSYLAKVLQEIAKMNLIRSTKGVKGGFTLNPKTKKMSLYKILTIIDGDFPVKYCFLKKTSCKKKTCALRELNEKIAKDIKNTLNNVNLDSLINNFKMEV